MSTETRSRLGGTRTVGRSGTLTRRTLTATALGAGMRRGRRVLRALRRGCAATLEWLRTTVSAAGWLLAGVAGLGVLGGLALGLVEGWVAAAISGALLLLSVPFLLGAHDYGVRLELARDRVVAGTEVAGRLEIVNRARGIALPGVVDVPVGAGLLDVHVPLLRGGAVHVESLTIGAHRRGVIQVGPLTIGRGDPVGILRREHAWPGVQQIFVHPVTVPIPSTSAGRVRDLEGSPTSDIVDADLSFHAIRPYVAGDSRRHVHWRSTAKTGALMVRQYEETRHSRLAILADLATGSYGSDEEFELAVSVAASLGVHGVREGRDVLVAASAGVPDDDRDARAIRMLPAVSAGGLLDGFAGIETAEHALALESVARLVVQAAPELSIAFLATGSRIELGRLRAAAVAFPSNVAVVAVRAEPGGEPTLRSTRELAVLTVGALGDLPAMMARGALR